MRSGLPAVFLLILAQLVLMPAAGAQGATTSVLQLSTQTTSGGQLGISEGQLTFDLALADYPSESRVKYVSPASGRPFTVTASGVPGVWWVLKLKVGIPVVNWETLNTLSPDDLQYRIEANAPNEPQGCLAAASDPGVWSQVGTGEPIIATFRGSGGGDICRLTVYLRVQTTSTLAPGPYQGTLVWTLDQRP